MMPLCLGRGDRRNTDVEVGFPNTRALQTRPGFHPEWKKALDAFLRKWVECERDAWATARALGILDLVML